MDARATGKSYEPLYLKYRPQKLDELVGQEAVYKTLKNAIEHERLTHAYLFTGPRGTGKTSSARILAKSLNCQTYEKAVFEPCLHCPSCMEIASSSSPAVFEIDAASNNSVDDARLLIERAPLVAVGSRYKIYIIDECHMLTKEAFNALLKTIEQPPPNVVFILATTEEHKVLPTIVSRCQRLIFRLINQDALCDHLSKVANLENIEIEDEALRLIARRSGGGLRDALGHLDQASLLASPGNPATVNDLLRLLGALHEDVLLQISEELLERRGQDLIQSLASLLEEGREPDVILHDLARHFLNLIKAAYLKPDQDLQSVVLGSAQYLSGLVQQAPKFEMAELSQIVEALDRLATTVRRTSQPTMHLEAGLLSICHRHDIGIVRELESRVARLEAAIAGGAPIVLNQSAPKASVSTKAPVAAKPPERPAPEPAPIVEAVVQNVSIIADPIADSTPKVEPEAKAVETFVNTDSDLRSPDELKSGDSVDEDLDYIWSQILDELQRRHLPTYSLTSMHAFPLSISQQELSLGVSKEQFQKMLETKLGHIKTASCAVVGRDIQVKVRVATGNPQPAANSSSANLAKPVSKPVAPLAKAPVKTELPQDDPVETSRLTDLEEEPEADAKESRPLSSAAVAEERSRESSQLKEAYKLFEGPGSRKIQ